MADLGVGPRTSAGSLEVPELTSEAASDVDEPPREVSGSAVVDVAVMDDVGRVDGSEVGFAGMSDGAPVVTTGCTSITRGDGAASQPLLNAPLEPSAARAKAGKK